MGAGATRTTFGPDELGGPGFVAGFPEPPKPTRHSGRQGAYRSQLRLLAMCREVPVNSHMWLGEMNELPAPAKLCDLDF